MFCSQNIDVLYKHEQQKQLQTNQQMKTQTNKQTPSLTQANSSYSKK
jgi:hypothetical protein